MADFRDFNKKSHFNRTIFAYIPFTKTDLMDKQTKRNSWKESCSLRNDPAFFIQKSKSVIWNVRTIIQNCFRQTHATWYSDEFEIKQKDLHRNVIYFRYFLTLQPLYTFLTFIFYNYMHFVYDSWHVSENIKNNFSVTTTIGLGRAYWILCHSTGWSIFF